MKLKNWIQLFALIGLIGRGFYGSFKKKRMLKSCSKETKATIVDKYTKKSRGYFIKYKYQVDGKEYESSESLKGDLEIETFQEGSTIEIEYSCEDPDFSKYIRIESTDK
ncbi:MAG: hypothetical protein AAF960_25280 [Bacteroidota bacterium]